MIRDARFADLKRLVELISFLFASSGNDKLFPYDAESVTKFLQGLILGPMGIVLVQEEDNDIQGLVVAAMFPSYFSNKHILCQELFLWVQPAYRGYGHEIVKALETRAKRLGAKAVSLSSMNVVRPKAMERFYRRMEYKPIENVFLKELT